MVESLEGHLHWENRRNIFSSWLQQSGTSVEHIWWKQRQKHWQAYLPPKSTCCTVLTLLNGFVFQLEIRGQGGKLWKSHTSFCFSKVALCFSVHPYFTIISPVILKKVITWKHCKTYELNQMFWLPQSPWCFLSSIISKLNLKKSYLRSLFKREWLVFCGPSVRWTAASMLLFQC